MSETENTKAVILQQPNEQKVYLDVNHSTDWIAVGAIVISLLAFIVTIVIVHTSTKSQINSNKSLIEAQNKLKKHELNFLYKSTEIDKFRNVIAEYFALLMKFNMVVSLAINKMERDELIPNLVSYFSEINNYHFQIELFLDCELDSNHSVIKNQLKQLIDSLWRIRAYIDEDKENINAQIVSFSNEFEIVRDSLTKLINNEVKLQKGE